MTEEFPERIRVCGNCGKQVTGTYVRNGDEICPSCGRPIGIPRSPRFRLPRVRLDWAIVSFAVVSAIVFVYLFYLALLVPPLGDPNLRAGYIALGALFLIPSLWALKSSAKGKCPSCGRWRARRLLGREYLSEAPGWGTVTRADDSYSTTTGPRGQMYTTTTTTYRSEQVHGTHVTFEDTFECRFCSHRWSLPWQKFVAD